MTNQLIYSITLFLLFSSCHNSKSFDLQSSPLSYTREDSTLKEELDSEIETTQELTDTLEPIVDSIMIGMDTVSKENWISSSPIYLQRVPNKDSSKFYRIKTFKVKLDSSHQLKLFNNEYRSFHHLIKQQESVDFVILTNGGMFHPGGEPVGLFIQDSLLYKINTRDGRGNFFLKPNGIFYVTDSNEVGILRTDEYIKIIANKNVPIKSATQSGPMLLYHDTIHPAFNFKSPNTNIRSGVGVTKNQEIIFILSEDEINLYDFATIFQDKGCTDALYLDGVISQMFIKEIDNVNGFTGRFGPVFGIIKKSKRSKAKKASNPKQDIKKEEKVGGQPLIPKNIRNENN